MSVARFLYSCLTWAAQPLLRRKLRRRAQQEPGYGVAVAERFGRYTPKNLGADGRGQWLWVHAVSLGETRAAAILIGALRAKYPQMRLLLTHGTATGRAEGQKLLREGDVQVWQPWDTLSATRRFVKQFRPAVGVLMETEIWPNLLAACQKAGVPVVLANARLNSKSQEGAQRLPWLMGPAYRSLRAIWAQTTGDAERLRTLGVEVDAVLGNLKFDVVPDTRLLEQGQLWAQAADRPVVMFASSREGEESMLLQALAQLPREQVRTVQWLIVPRHPQRFDEVQQLIEKAGWSVGRRSQWGDGLPVPADFWLGDSMGEMHLYYGMSQIALLGGSFAPLGGQNLIEAAACGCPMLLGPHTFNFADAAEQAVEAGAAGRVEDLTQAVSTALEYVTERQPLVNMQQHALDFAAAHRGAAAATAEWVLETMRAPKSSQ